eukprot:116802_1
MGNKQTLTTDLALRYNNSFTSYEKLQLKTNEFSTEKDAKTDETIKINVTAAGFVGNNKSVNKLVIITLYRDNETLANIFHKVNEYIRQKYYPAQVSIDYVYENSFTHILTKEKIQSELLNPTPITNWRKYKTGSTGIIPQGLTVRFSVHTIQYIHKIKSNGITCRYMNKFKTKDALKCPIYHAMKQNYEFTQDNLDHMNLYIHFDDEFEHKPPCKYGQECKAYIRCEQGQDRNRINDKCHMKIFRHPPRTRKIKLAQDVNPLIVSKSPMQNYLLYKPTSLDAQKYGLKLMAALQKKNSIFTGDGMIISGGWQHDPQQEEGYLAALINEVIANGYGNDLCLNCGENDECKHDVYSSEYSILYIVYDKLKCHRHKVMGTPLTQDLILALILYTGCECNYDLCSTQRNGDFDKWKWFDLLLWTAIYKLSIIESGAFKVYSGLNAVKMSGKHMDNGYFITYTSTSWNQKVAKRFMQDKGMMIQFDQKYKQHQEVYCCDVSWVSKFADECEILFARSLHVMESQAGDNQFQCDVLDDSSGVQ